MPIKDDRPHLPNLFPYPGEGGQAYSDSACSSQSMTCVDTTNRNDPHRLLGYIWRPPFPKEGPLDLSPKAEEVTHGVA